MTLDASVNPTGRFSDRVANYIKHRPAYPPAVIDALRAHCGLGADSVVADVGSGTGILTRMLLDTGCFVWAVEPNSAMRAAAERDLAHDPHFHSIAATAEDLPFETASIDLITAAQAFHWFDRAAAARAFDRVLRPTGHVALIWNDRNVLASPFMRGYEDTLIRFVPEYQDVSYRNIVHAPIDAFFGPAGHDRHTFDYVQTFDLDGVLGRFQSSSYAPRPGDPRLEAALDHLRGLFDACAQEGTVDFAYKTLMFIGRPQVAD